MRKSNGPGNKGYRDLEERLLARSVLLPTGCWMWLGVADRNGYAGIDIDGKRPGVHRVAYCVFTGKTIPVGYDVDHLCKFTLCINPAHLDAKPAAVNRKNVTSFTRSSEASADFA